MPPKLKDSLVGGGVVSAELCRSPWSEYPDAGDKDSGSLGISLVESGGVVTPSVGFMATRTDAASKSWTCWCLLIRSFEVKDHSGVCSQLNCC
jgi:hypothetical protein